ncbi:hypothetical protein [Dyella sp. 2HG41-7]|uniref:hypothetical protein n=1 Tax=Dyella sp. 2HG41-7 TaxID=2883239 RepID=UPI001F2CFF6F|nr:hypothetical protein [Dyella sp. 2HG41-7]
MNRSRLPLQMMGLLGLLGSAAAVRANESTEPPQSVDGLGTPVSSERLDDVRGGFDLGDGLDVSFGIERAVYVDGNLVTYTNLNIPDIAHITAQQALALAGALSTVDVQVGPGNTVNPSSTTQNSATSGSKQNGLGNVVPNLSNLSSGTKGNSVIPSSVGTSASNSQPVAVLVSSAFNASPMLQPTAATVIQNTVDNQVITSLTTLNVAVNTLNAMRTAGIQQTLEAAQIQALAH